jgi:hypothetical protein
MAKEKSVIEQALLEASQIDATFKANAKEILAQTMGSEIEEMVKESLEDSPMATDEENDDMEMATDLEMGDELDLELGDDDEDDLDLGLDMDDEDELEGDMDIVDLTDSDDEELIKVFKAMDPDSEIEVVQDEDGVSFTDTETGAEYKVELGGGDVEMDVMDLEMGDDDEIEYEDGMEIGDDEEVIDLEAGDELEYEDEELEEEVVYEIEISEEDDDEVEEGGDSLEEAPRTMSKLKGRKYGNPKPRQESRRPSPNHKIVKENKVLKSNINSLKAEKVELVENQEKMVDALKQFRQKLQEVAVFNSNLAHVVRLFTENTTTKEEKVDIVKRMDEATTLKESKMMFKNINKELTGVKSKKTIKESVEAKVNKTA